MVWTLCLFLLLCESPAWAGSTFIQPYRAEGLTKVVQVHHKVFIEPPDSMQFKIVFGWWYLHTPGAANPEYYQIENNLWSFHNSPQQDGCGGSAHTIDWSRPNYSLEIPDYPEHGKVGERRDGQQTLDAFDLIEGGIDGIDNLTKIGSGAANLDVSNKVIDVTLTRVGLIADPGPFWGYRLPGGCTNVVPPGTYWIWEVVSEIDGTAYRHQFIVPEDQGRYVDEEDAVFQILTEFMSWPGRWTTRFWDFWVVDEGQGKVPVTEFIVSARYFDDTVNLRDDWGAARGDFQGHPVIEIGSGGSEPYLRVGQTISLRTPVTIPAATIGDMAVLGVALLTLLTWRLRQLPHTIGYIRSRTGKSWMERRK